jgi:hypothetical protein
MRSGGDPAFPARIGRRANGAGPDLSHTATRTVPIESARLARPIRTDEIGPDAIAD